MNKNIIGATIKADKDKIVKLYQEGMLIHDIADKYNVTITTIGKYLRGWGIKLKKGDYASKVKKQKRFKRRFSEELKAKQKYNADVNANSKRVKYITDYNQLQEDERLIHSIIQHHIIG